LYTNIDVSSSFFCFILPYDWIMPMKFHKRSIWTARLMARYQKSPIKLVGDHPNAKKREST
jgi:hypothetical protein